MLDRLAAALRDARAARGVSLEAIAQPARISAPYLLKLERGAVGSPSPRVLARLAAVLEVPYLRLMELAGYLDEEQIAELQGRTPRRHPLADQALTPDEWRQVGAFIRQVIDQRS